MWRSGVLERFEQSAGGWFERLGPQGRTMKRLSATGMLVLVLMTSWSATLPVATAQTNDMLPVDGLLNEVLAEPGTVYHNVVSVANNSTFLGSVECVTCVMTLSKATTSHNFTESLNLNVMDGGEWNLTLTVEQRELVRFSIGTFLSDEHPSVRPAPQQTAPTHTAGVCSTTLTCIGDDHETLLGKPPSGQEEAFLASGYLEGSDEFHVVEVEAGDTVEWQWLATSAGISVEAYAQTSTTESILPGSASLTSAYLQPSQNGSVAWWTSPEEGRMVFRLSTNDTQTAWMALVLLHRAQPVIDLSNQHLDEALSVRGHGSTTVLFDWPINTKLNLGHPHHSTEVRLDQLMNGSWVLGAPTILNTSSGLSAYPYPGVTGGRLVIDSTAAFAVDMSGEQFGDMSGLEAPFYRPEGLDDDNRSWPVLNLSEVIQAQLTLAVHDTSDTYRLVIEGWEDSIHYVQFTLAGNVSGMEAQLWDIDQYTGEVLATDITRPVSDQLRIGLQVGRGTHFVQFRLQDPNASTSHLWGDDVAPIRYTIAPEYDLLDEGERPWFEPSDDAVWWGGVARWFLGFLFLIPAMYVGFLFRRDRQFALELVQKASRLEWYSQRLSNGETTIKASRKDLNRALMAVAQLPWEEGINAWGRPTLTHTTEGVAMGAWRVDSRLARTKGAHPLVIGVHVLKGTWELAALRFDAPQGQAFEVVHVEPRFLFQGEEVFLDTLNEGHRAFVYVELTGEAPAVDIELNGRIDRVPFASRMPQTVLMEEE